MAFYDWINSSKATLPQAALIAIQNKVSTTFCHLDDLVEYASVHNAKFDFLIAAHQNTSLKSEYENALDCISNAAAPKQLITQDKWEAYTRDTFNFLKTKKN